MEITVKSEVKHSFNFDIDGRDLELLLMYLDSGFEAKFDSKEDRETAKSLFQDLYNHLSMASELDHFRN